MKKYLITYLVNTQIMKTEVMAEGADIGPSGLEFKINNAVVASFPQWIEVQEL